MICEECGKDKPRKEIRLIPEDDEGGVWFCCQDCWAWIEDTADLMEG